MSTIQVTVGNSVINITTEAQGAAGVVGVFQGAYSALTDYVINDVVSYNGILYICILASTGNLPTNSTYWEVLLSFGYVPEDVANKSTNVTTDQASNTKYPSVKAVYDWAVSFFLEDGTTTASVPDSSNKRYVTDAQLTILGNTSGTNSGDNATNTTSNTYADGKVADAINNGTTTIAPSQNAVFDALALKEDLTNKSTDITTDGASNTKYPGVKAIKDYVDTIVTGLLDYRGAYDASVNTFPASGGSGTAGAVVKGDMWILSVAGTLGGVAVQIGDSVIANVDTPGQTAGNWNILNSNISYVPEDVANKVTSISGASTDTQYGSAKLLYDQLVLAKARANHTGTQLAATISDFNATALLAAPAETVTTIGALIGGAGDATPNDTDYVATSLTASGILKKITWTNVKAFLKTYFDTIYVLVGANITLSENTSIGLDPAGSADGKYTGITVTGTAGATLAFGDVVVLDVTDSRWELADANSAVAADGDPRGMIGICVLAAAGDGSATKILLQGIVRADAKFPALTITAPVYLSETAGAIVVAQPVTTDVVVRVLGFALTADEIYFNPSSDYIIHV